MKSFFSLLTAILFCASHTFAQNKKIPVQGSNILSVLSSPEQDCINAIPICINQYTQQNSYSGQGNLPNEINPVLSCLTAGERNDVWYTLKVQSSGNLSFTITPNTPTDDYDWAVFNLTNAACSQIAVDGSLQVSCNFSANVGCNGSTGANGNTSGTCGQMNEPVIPVTTGDIYVINVSNFSASQGGYTINFASSTASIWDNTPPVAAPIAIGCTKKTFSILFNENIDGNTISASTNEFRIIDSSGITWNIANALLPVSTGGVVANRVDFTLASAPEIISTAYLIAQNGSDNNTFADNCGNFVLPLDTLAVITVMNDVDVNLGGDISVCPNSPAPILNAQNNGATFFNWYYNGNPATNGSSTFQTSLPGIYSVQVVYGTGCEASNSITLSLLQQPAINLGSDITICTNQSFASIDAGNNGNQYAWYHNNSLVSTSQIVQPQDAGTYIASVTGAYCTNNDTIVLSYFQETIIDLQNEFEICDGEQVHLDVSNIPATSYIWIENHNVISTLPQITIDVEGLYNLILNDQNNCQVTDNILIRLVQQPGIPLTECPITFSNTKEFKWEPVNGAEGYEVSENNGQTWQPPSSGTGSLVHVTPVSLQNILIRSTSQGNCKAGEPVSTPFCNYEVPSGISPNNDGLNDFFEIKNLESYPGTTVRIFNRFGQQIYFSDHYANEWNAREQPEGTYFYSIHFTDGNLSRGFISVRK